MKRWTNRWLRRQIPKVERQLRARNLATDEEIRSVAEKYTGGSRPELCEHYAELRTFARRMEWRERKRGNDAAADGWTAVDEAITERAERVHLESIDETVRIVPASKARMDLIDHADWWLFRFVAARQLLRAEAEEGNPRDGLHELLENIEAEIREHRAVVYTQVTAPEPAIYHGENVAWADAITPEEEIELLQAYHRVNIDVLKRLPRPVSRDGNRNLPSTWGTFFSRLESMTEHDVSAHTFYSDRSLAALVASVTARAIDRQQREQARKN